MERARKPERTWLNIQNTDRSFWARVFDEFNNDYSSLVSSSAERTGTLGFFPPWMANALWWTSFDLDRFESQKMSLQNKLYWHNNQGLVLTLYLPWVTKREFLKSLRGFKFEHCRSIFFFNRRYYLYDDRSSFSENNLILSINVLIKQLLGLWSNLYLLCFLFPTSSPLESLHFQFLSLVQGT